MWTPQTPPEPTKPRRRALLAAASLGLLLAGCASTDASAGVAARITLRQFAAGGAGDLELRSESHTDRVEYYSTARGGAAVKIMRDDLMGALLRGFDEAGYPDFASPGPGPQSGGGGIRKVIEIERDGAVTHVTTSRSSTAEQIELVSELSTGFFQAYNAIRSYQTIEDGDDRTIFLGPAN